jgi:hypothetical protein
MSANSLKREKKTNSLKKENLRSSARQPRGTKKKKSEK